MTTVYGIFNTVSDANAAITNLNSNLVRNEDISVVTKENSDLVALDKKTTATGQALDGTAAGGIVGGLMGLLVGLAAITIPPIGPVLLAGPIVTALGITGATAAATSGAVTGAIAGGLIGGLLKLGIPENEATEYERKIMNGAILLGVNADESTEGRIKDILNDSGAEDVTTIKN